MKRSGYKSIIHIYVITLILFIGTTAAGVGMLIYNITIQKTDGHNIICRWPIEFTEDFSRYITFTKYKPIVGQKGKLLLKKNNLWLQLIDVKGDEVQNINKPGNIPVHYSPADILDVYQSGKNGCSVFFGKIRFNNREWTYMIGFPLRISRITMYVNKDRFITAKPIVLVMFGSMILLLILISFFYGYKVTRQLDGIRKAIKDIALRIYNPVDNRSVFGDVFEELNILDSHIKAADEEVLRTEKLREEWIANITHDLKTPLSPIRGYSELISDPSSRIEDNEIRKYGGIILKNARYAEELINDLKLTYQLKNEMLPLKKSSCNIVRFMRELIIDILNNVDYELRNITFSSEKEDILLSIDPVLIKRAMNNFLVNALVHNDNSTDINVMLSKHENTQIVIQDNGRGMTKEELENLFVRYYRGSSMDMKPEGLGLGMAIAKQIVELHGGSIEVESELGKGTRIIIELI